MRIYMHVYTVSNDAKHRRKIQKVNDCNEVTGLLFLSHFSSIIVFLSVNCLPQLSRHAHQNTLLKHYADLICLQQIKVFYFVFDNIDILQKQKVKIPSSIGYFRYSKHNWYYFTVQTIRRHNLIDSMLFCLLYFSLLN